VPDLHPEVLATEKRLAASERALFRAGAHSLTDSSVTDYVMFAKEFRPDISLGSSRLKPSKLPVISIANVRMQKGPFPSLPCASIAKGAAAQGSAPASERRNRRENKFSVFAARTSIDGGFLSAPACRNGFSIGLLVPSKFIQRENIFMR
jgi:hypothetical protein